MNKIKSSSVLSLSVFILFSFTGCSLFNSSQSSTGGGVKLSQVASTSKLKVIKREIDRKAFARTLEEPQSLTALRIVAVYRRSNRQVPEYHLFQIQPGDPYHQLGLRNGDILRAANDWLLFDSERFRTYVDILQYANSGFIDIYRKGRPIQYQYQLVPQRDSTVIPQQGVGLP